MIFNSHSDLAGKHAFLSASKYHWINYDEEKLEQSFITAMAAARGTRIHNIAQQLITEGIKMGRSKTTLNMYVNDALGFRMTPEQILFYSENAFGTADAISFRKDVLRIHDLKTGVIPGSPKQLYIYAALFCLEYGIKPPEIQMDLRLYQNDAIEMFEPDPKDIIDIMATIIRFDKYINDVKREAMS